MNRRGFLQAFASAVAVAAAGVPVLTLLDDAPKLKARHMTSYDLHCDAIRHRLDVRVGQQQYCVDFVAPNEVPTEQQVEYAAKVMTDMIEREHGDRFTLDIRAFRHDVTAANKWFYS